MIEDTKLQNPTIYHTVHVLRRLGGGGYKKWICFNLKLFLFYYNYRVLVWKCRGRKVNLWARFFLICVLEQDINIWKELLPSSNSCYLRYIETQGLKCAQN